MQTIFVVAILSRLSSSLIFSKHKFSTVGVDLNRTPSYERKGENNCDVRLSEEHGLTRK